MSVCLSVLCSDLQLGVSLSYGSILRNHMLEVKAYQSTVQQQCHHFPETSCSIILVDFSGRWSDKKATII